MDALENHLRASIAAMRGALLAIPHRLKPIADCVTSLQFGLLVTVAER